MKPVLGRECVWTCTESYRSLRMMGKQGAEGGRAGVEVRNRVQGTSLRALFVF